MMPSPLRWPLPIPGINQLIGATITVNSDGSVVGDTGFTVNQSSPYTIVVYGTPFGGSLLSMQMMIYVPGGNAINISGSILQDGSTSPQYGVAFNLAVINDAPLNPGIYRYTIVGTSVGSSSPQTLVDDAMSVAGL